MMERLPLKLQFIITFGLILLLSLAATLVTYGVGYFFYTGIEYKKVYPANYYEKQIPAIEEQIRQTGPSLLDPARRPVLEQMIPLEGISYQVLDNEGRIIYGTYQPRVIKNKNEFYSKINNNIGLKGNRFARLVPVIDNGGRIRGGVLLSYVLTPTFTSRLNRLWLLTLFFAVIISPFLYIILFTWLLARSFAGRINRPLNMLIEASRKIREKNLDFRLDYHAPNELGRLCQAFNEMKMELEKSLFARWRMEQERQELVVALSHDLKTPLSIIQGYVEALLEGGMGDPHKLEKYLQVIRASAIRGSGLIQEMQEAMELEDANIGLELTPVDVAAFVQGKKESYELLSREKGIRFELSLFDTRQFPEPCLVDIAKLERILDNIVFNSVRYTPDGGNINIAVRVESERIYFEVCDSGKGFSKQDMANLFRKFYRGDAARSRQSGHAGLGLFIARQLVERHGGTIRAFNSREGGACVTFDIKTVSHNQPGRC